MALVDSHKIWFSAKDNESEQLAKDEVLTVLERASKQGNVIEEEDMEHLLYEAKSRLELYQFRGARGFHVWLIDSWLNEEASFLDRNRKYNFSHLIQMIFLYMTVFGKENYILYYQKL